MLRLVVVLALLAMPAGAERVDLGARTIEEDGVVVAFPAVAYEAPDGSGPPAVVAARAASAALGAAVDPDRDLVAVTPHRVVLKDPTDAGRILKVYRADRHDAGRVARYLQRDLGLETFLRDLGLRLATIDRAPRLLERGVIRQERVAGRPLDLFYPRGYPAGADPAVDRVLATIARVDVPLRGIVARQSGLFLANTADCVHEVPVGVDVGHCLGNLFRERATRDVVLIDW